MAFLGGKGGYKPEGGKRPETPKIPGPTGTVRGQPSPYSDGGSRGSKVQTCPHCGKDINDAPSIENNPAIIQHYLTTLNDMSHQLTDWERNFLQSLSDQWESRGSLSDKQVATLSKIYAAKS